MSGSYEDYIYKQEQRQAAILDVPDQIADLEQQLSKANSVGSKFKDYFIGGVIGAILGVIVSKLAG